MQVCSLKKKKCFHVEASFSVVKRLSIILKEVWVYVYVVCACARPYKHIYKFFGMTLKSLA